MGVLASALLSLLGLILWSTRSFKPPEPNASLRLSGIISSALAGNETGIVYLAVIILIATPIFRVAVSSIYFAAEKDRKYVGITLVVLAMLVFALISGSGV